MLVCFDEHNGMHALVNGSHCMCVFRCWAKHNTASIRTAFVGDFVVAFRAKSTAYVTNAFCVSSHISVCHMFCISLSSYLAAIRRVKLDANEIGIERFRCFGNNANGS